MRFISVRSAGFAAVLLLGLVAGCVGPPTQAPRPQPAPAPRPVPQAPPPPPPQSADWRDWPVTPGTWVYRGDARGSVALFGVAGAAPVLSLRCDRIANAVSLATPALPAVAGPTAMTIRTTSLVRALAAAPSGADTVASLEPRDALLDAIAFSRGRFIVEQRGAATLAVPAWAEVGRVIEDCRR